jgi:gluconolactonase
LNSPNDIVCKSDGSIWFTDPPFGILGYYEGYRGQAGAADQRLPRRRQDRPAERRHRRRRPPQRLAFSPDESKLYVVEAAVTPRVIVVFDVEGGTRLTNKRKFIDAGPGTPDGFRCDVDGNLWCGWGMGQEGLDGVAIYNPTVS